MRPVLLVLPTGCGGDMRQWLAPTIFLAAIGLLAGTAYRYFVDDPDEATLANYLRSALHGMGASLSGWAVHLYFTSRSSAWVTKWPLVIELLIKSVFMAVVVAAVAIGMQAALYEHRIDNKWLARSVCLASSLSLLCFLC
jgi:hypothetical protein